MTVRKIGKILLCVITIGGSLVAAPRVELAITDMNGSHLTTIATGIPFQAQISVIDVDEKFSQPVLHGIHNFVRGATGSSTYITMVNGKSSSRRVFSYVLRADRQGTFALGPARIHHNNAVLESNMHTFEVVQASRTSSALVQGQPAILMVEVDKKRIFVGEPLVVTITLLHEPEARLHSPMAMDLEREGFISNKQRPATTRHVVVNGKTYVSIEQKLELYVHDAGDHTIPALNAQVQILAKRRVVHSVFDLDDFFGRNIEIYQVVSAPCTIEVMPLPFSKKSAQAIGEFKNFTAQLEQKEARIGEGTVLKLSIEGTGDAKKVEFPALDVPSGITSYESKSEVEDRGDTWKKTFEYIVQATVADTYEIPSQQFTYFDLMSGTYKTLTTQALSLAIVGNAGTVAQKPVEKIPEVNESPKIISSLPLVHEPGTMLNVPQISKHAFYYTLALFLSVIGFFSFSSYKTTPQKNACKKARSLLYAYKQKGDATKLYQLMVNLFTEHAGMVSIIDEQGACMYLQNKGFDQAKIDELSKDFSCLAEAAFMTQSSVDKEALFVRVQYWVDELQQKS